MKTPLTYKISYSDDSFVSVIAKGIANPKQVEDMYKEIIAEAKSYSSDKIMLDAAQISLEYPLTELVPLMNRLKTIIDGFKVARICNKYEHRQDLIEGLGNKQKLSIKNFGDTKEALSWLQSERD
ncbi:MAG: hypothetical protein HWE10_07005 [Gammaproteobacteria bacterium]|nr:hypothetical protein [Gammaproteobacteria bacterium]